MSVVPLPLGWEPPCPCNHAASPAETFHPTFSSSSSPAPTLAVPLPFLPPIAAVEDDAPRFRFVAPPPARGADADTAVEFETDFRGVEGLLFAFGLPALLCAEEISKCPAPLALAS